MERIYIDKFSLINLYSLTDNNQWWPDFDELEKLNLDRVKVRWVKDP